MNKPSREAAKPVRVLRLFYSGLGSVMVCRLLDNARQITIVFIVD